MHPFCSRITKVYEIYSHFDRFIASTIFVFLHILSGVFFCFHFSRFHSVHPDYVHVCFGFEYYFPFITSSFVLSHSNALSVSSFAIFCIEERERARGRGTYTVAFSRSVSIVYICSLDIDRALDVCVCVAGVEFSSLSY